MYVALFVVVSVLWYVVKAATAPPPDDATSKVTPEFKSFQRSYLIVYVFVMAADWLQGPYVYALYESYGFPMETISLLFIVGFGTSGLVGPFVGSASDKYGRKAMCIVYCVAYGLSCATKHSSDLSVLLVGRFLGGISTSILYSSFEAWMVSAHHSSAYGDAGLQTTFSSAFTYNSFVAVASGVVGEWAAGAWGPVGPFDVSMLCLIVSGGLVATLWKENYGDQQAQQLSTVSTAFTRMVEDKKIWLLGLMQSVFEGAMFVFVFMWTPALRDTVPDGVTLAHGWVFSSFMVCTAIGSAIFGYVARRKVPLELCAFWLFVVAAASMFIAAVAFDHTIRLFAFFVFEGCVGMFWPSVGTLRSRYVPEDVRATVMNIFRIPLNIIVVVVLLRVGSLSQTTVFLLCCLMQLLVAGAALALHQHVQTSPGGKKGSSDADDIDGLDMEETDPLVDSVADARAMDKVAAALSEPASRS